MTNVFLSVFGISVSCSLVVAPLILLTPFLNKRYAARWKYWVWIFLALRLAIPFRGTEGKAVLDAWFQGREQTVSGILDGGAEGAGGGDGQPGQEAPPVGIVVEIPAQLAAPIAPQAAKSGTGLTWLDAAAILWAAGCLLFLSVHLLSYLRYADRVAKRGTIIKDTYILSQISRLKRELHIRSAVCAVEYPEADSPMIMGFFSPILILPERQYDPEKLYFILKHELIHHKRRDVYKKFLFMAANAVHWFNPLIWWMQREAVVDMELSCDERVTQGEGYAVRKAYTESLFSSFQEQCRKSTLLSTQFYGGTQIMKKRFQNILQGKRKKNGAAVLACTVVLTAALGTLVGCSVGSGTPEDISGRQENPDGPGEGDGGSGQPETLTSNTGAGTAASGMAAPGSDGDLAGAAPGSDGNLSGAAPGSDGDLSGAAPSSDGNLSGAAPGSDGDPSGAAPSDGESVSNGMSGGIPDASAASAEAPRDGQIYGYLSGFDGGSATVDWQIWATPGSQYWKPEYDEDAGFEVVDAEGEDITYPISGDCTYSVLENHYDPVLELSPQEFASYLTEMEFPVLWVIELEEGQIKSISEQYRP